MNKNEEKKRGDVAVAKNAGFVADILTTSVKYFKWIALAIVLVILFSGLRTVKEGEVAVILRFGKIAGDTREEQVHEPGLLFAFPYVIDEVVTIPTGRVYEVAVETHYTEGEMSPNVTENGYCITGDHNVVLISTSLKYTVSDPVAFALHTGNVDTTVRGVVSAAITSYVAGNEIDPLLTSGKEEFSLGVLSAAQQILDRIGCGIKLEALEIINMAPPSEVKLVFDSVNAASVRRETMLAEAKEYATNTVALGKTEASSIVTNASLNQNNALNDAEKRLVEFKGLLEEYEKNSDVVILRVYYEKLAQLYEKVGKVVYVENEGNPNIVLP